MYECVEPDGLAGIDPQSCIGMSLPNLVLQIRADGEKYIKFRPLESHKKL